MSYLYVEYPYKYRMSQIGRSYSSIISLRARVWEGFRAPQKFFDGICTCSYSCECLEGELRKMLHFIHLIHVFDKTSE